MPASTPSKEFDNCTVMLADWIERRYNYFLVWRRQTSRDTEQEVLLGHGLKLGETVNPSKFTWANLLLAFRLRIDDTVWVREDGQLGLSVEDKRRTMKRIIQVWLSSLSKNFKFSCLDVLASSMISGPVHSSRIPFFPDPYTTTDEDTVSLWTFPPRHIVQAKLFLRLIHSEYP